MLAAFMAANNLIWFVLWWLFFGVAGRIRGWTIADVAELYGIVAVAFGIYATFFGGARHLARLVMEGELDVYLGRPRSPLLGILFSRCDPTGIGDILSGAGLVAWVEGAAPKSLLLALALAALGASVIVATYVAINCLAFWCRGRSSFFDQLFECFLTLASMPQLGLPRAATILLYTVLPAAFVGFVPVEILRSFTLEKLAAVLAAAMFFPALAAGLFRLGIARYVSGNRVIEPQ
ncbi:MAG TPA: ABC-2 family transporter protein [Gammaproteobacteria bacterium]|nr:ABC-2 family transporter protein [Gammaproteobacteria bacterium]